MKRLVLVVLVFMVFVLPARGAELSVELRYLPSGSAAATAPPPTPDLTGQPLKILPFSDSRPGDQAVIGEIRRDGQSLTLRTKTSVAIFAANAFRTVYGEWGGHQAEAAPLVLKGDVTRFVLEEGDGYSAAVGIRFSLSDASGLSLWDGSTAGVVKGVGRILTETSYPEIMSDVVREAYQQLLGDEKLRAVWSGKIRPPAGAIRQ